MACFKLRCYTSKLKVIMKDFFTKQYFFSWLQPWPLERTRKGFTVSKRKWYILASVCLGTLITGLVIDLIEKILKDSFIPLDRLDHDSWSSESLQDFSNFLDGLYHWCVHFWGMKSINMAFSYSKEAFQVIPYRKDYWLYRSSQSAHSRKRF